MSEPWIEQIPELRRKLHELDAQVQKVQQQLYEFDAQVDELHWEPQEARVAMKQTRREYRLSIWDTHSTLWEVHQTREFNQGTDLLLRSARKAEGLDSWW